MSIHKMLCTLGRFDIPIIQMQPPFLIDLLDTNVILFGTSMSGKTTFMKTLINILHKQYNNMQEQVFILDFGGALADYKEFPLVSAYFDNGNEEYVKRVFKIMDNILKNNVRELKGKNYRNAQNQPIHTTFLIDNLNAFMDEPRYTAYQEKLAKLCRDGLSKGITIVVSAAETKGLNSYLGNFKQKIAFEMPEDKYAEIFTDKAGQIGSNPGHGFANVTVRPEGITGTFRMNLPYEVQCALPYREAEWDCAADTRESFTDKLKEKFGFLDGCYEKCVKKYQMFPEELTADVYEKIRQIPENGEKEPGLPIPVALDYIDFYPVTVDLDQSHVVAIYGKKEFGKTNLLRLLLSGIMRQKPEARIVFFDDGRNQLKEIYEKYRRKIDSVYFNGFRQETIRLKAAGAKQEEIRTKKLSPLQRFYLYLHNNYIDLPKRIVSMFDLLEADRKRIAGRNEYEDAPFTVFIIQSKLVYLNAYENRCFIEKVLPELAADAEENGCVFIFSDVQKISDMEINTVFNNVIGTAFLLDNIAEFAGERGQKTVFGNMDVKALKEDYARCEKGDGYFYDIEADHLLKAKFIKYEED